MTDLPGNNWSSTLRIAVLIPCHNEELTVGKVVSSFRHSLPESHIYVYDNNSTDKTALVAEAAGAIVRQEELQGKGHVIRRMFSDIEADIYVLVDGDDTYDAGSAPPMIRMLLTRHYDMVTATRVSTVGNACYRFGHRFVNRLFSGIVAWIFGDRILDMLSGFRVFTRRFVKSFPALSLGFETETEFTVHALELNLPVGQIDSPYRARPEGSHSKLNTYSDGFRILFSIFELIKEERPLQFFSLIAAILFLIAVILIVPIILEFDHTGLVRRFPTAILCTGIMLLSSLSFFCGLILESIASVRKEAKRIAYLSFRPPFD